MNVSLVALCGLDYAVIQAPSIAVVGSVPQHEDAIDRIACMETFALRYRSLDLEVGVWQYICSKGARECYCSRRRHESYTLTFFNKANERTA